MRFFMLPVLLAGMTGCNGELCTSSPYLRAFDLAKFCSRSTACSLEGLFASHDGVGDSPDAFGAFYTRQPILAAPGAVIDLTQLGDVVATKPVVGVRANPGSGGLVPTMFHFDADTPCSGRTDVLFDAPDFACDIPPSAATLTFMVGAAGTDGFSVYLVGGELAYEESCAI